MAAAFEMDTDRTRSGLSAAGEVRAAAAAAQVPPPPPTVDHCAAYLSAAGVLLNTSVGELGAHVAKGAAAAAATVAAMEAMEAQNTEALAW